MFQELTITAAIIELKRDKNGKTYFLISNRETGIAYFTLSKKVKGWYDLATKWPIAKEVWIKFDEKRKVVALKIIKVYPRFPKQEREREMFNAWSKAPNLTMFL